jgi:transposase
MVRRKVLEEGVSRRQLARQTGLSRNTIRKMLLHELPQPYKPRPPKHPALRQHTATLDAIATSSVFTIVPHQVSISEVYRYLKRQENSSASYGAVRNYLKYRVCAPQTPNKILWEHLYEKITSSSKKDAINILRSLSFNGSPLISSTRLQRFGWDVASLREHRVVCSRHGQTRQDVDWLNRVLRTDTPPVELEGQYRDPGDSNELIARLHVGSKPVRNRAMAILAHLRGISDHTIATALGMSRLTIRRCRHIYESGGVNDLFTRKAKPRLKINDEGFKASIFALLHEPPKIHGINRTTWTMAEIRAVLAKQGRPACAGVVRAITKAAGYKWRKARLVLTSNDSQYAEKLAHIRLILSGLGPDEAFFSIDEFGPFAVKAKPGRVLAAPGEEPQVPQWQKSKGCLIVTAALELSGNQVSHFYSAKKNTTEMIRMMDLLLDRYRDRRKLYLSWDAASWHISKRLFERIEENNKAAIASGGPIVDTAPLPARAQFLNVIESIFSGMARAIIHSSNYRSVEEAKGAINRYFDERNRHFREHPRRAGKKIWGEERVPSEFGDGNCCKDPRFR